MLALTDVSATLGLLGIFVVLFPILVNVLVVLAVGQVLGERQANQNYRKHTRNS